MGLRATLPNHIPACRSELWLEEGMTRVVDVEKETKFYFALILVNPETELCSDKLSKSQ